LALSAPVAEAFLFRAGVLGRPFLSLHGPRRTPLRKRFGTPVEISCCAAVSLIKDEGVPIDVAGERRRFGRAAPTRIPSFRRYAEDRVALSKMAGEVPLEGPSWHVRTMALRAMPAFDGRLDAGPPRCGERAARQAVLQSLGVRALLLPGPRRELPPWLLRLPRRAVGVAPRRSDAAARGSVEMRGPPRP